MARHGRNTAVPVMTKLISAGKEQIMKTQKTSSETKRNWRRLFGAPQHVLAVAPILLAAVLALALPAQSGEPGVGGKRGAGVMQVNLFIGAGIDRVMALNPADPNYLYNLVSTVTGIYYELAASQPEVRLQGVARQIAARMPDFVSVEEASLIRIQSPGDLIIGGTTPATDVVYDYLKILTNALAAQGAHYAIVSTANEIDVEMPMLNLTTGGVDDIRWNDRDAILARTDLPPGQLRVTNPQSGNFANVIQIPGTGIEVTRGWCSVDAFIRGMNFRYICPHLEEETAPQIQALQAAELLTGPANTRLPVMIVGDFNADPLGRDGSFAYSLFPAAGFSDAWAVLHPSDLTGGLTWGHDESLSDPTAPFDRRIDFVFYRGAGFVPQSADVLDLWLNRSAAPLWSSDHAAVSAEFRIK
jgi:endonuclease/exonuclease/phosphatase family metal-dependent hydrolase